jgi:hypothetical protein
VNHLSQEVFGHARQVVTADVKQNFFKENASEWRDNSEQKPGVPQTRLTLPWSFLLPGDNPKVAGWNACLSKHASESSFVEMDSFFLSRDLFKPITEL